MAERISLITGPPDGWQPDHPLILHRPPYPTEDLMRSSRLFQIMNAGVTTESNMDAPEMRERARKMSITRDDHDTEVAMLDLDLNPDLL